MNKSWLFLGKLLCLALFTAGYAQMAIAQFELDTVKLTNPSFEDEPKQSLPPVGWMDCGFRGQTPPDVHPIYPPSQGWWVTMDPQDGKTYMGMVVRDNDTWERVSQRTRGTMNKGHCYEFSIWLARSRSYVSPSRLTEELTNYTTPTVLRVWGGNSACDRVQLLAESKPVDNNEWKKYQFQFKPDQDFKYIMLEAFYETPVLFPYNGNLLLDNASDISRIPCNETEYHQMEELLAEKVDEEEIATEVQRLASTGHVRTSKPEPKPTNENASSKKQEANVNPPPQRTGPPVRSLGGIHRSKLQEGQLIRINRLYFDADTFNIKPESHENLDLIAYFLIDNPEFTVEIGGHTNDLPSEEYCKKLSRERARSVTQFLIARGVDPARLSYRGYGKSKPIATNKTAIGRRMNQRVEIKILGMDENGHGR